jgi:hypothetical protein
VDWEPNFNGVKVSWTPGLHTETFEVIEYALRWQGGQWTQTKQQNYPGLGYEWSVWYDPSARLFDGGYVYEVIAHNQYGSSAAWSNRLFPPPAPPPAYFNAVLDTPDHVTLSWDQGQTNLGFDLARERFDIVHSAWVADRSLATGLGPSASTYTDTNFRAAEFIYRHKLTIHSSGTTSFSVYARPNHEAVPLWQDSWVWCSKCQGLVFAGNASPGPCPGGGTHDHRSANYSVLVADGGGITDPNAQGNWRWCNKCQGLAFAGNASPGPCPTGPGQVHNHAGSGEYYLTKDNPYPPGQDNWRWCNKCQGLAFAGNGDPGSCPAGAGQKHDHTGSANYGLRAWR